jgi:hypothetical protein
MKRKAHFQRTLAAQASFEKYGRKSRREEFLIVMEVVVPWRELESLIEPHYPKAGNGRHPAGLSIMLRVYFLQQWFNLSIPAPRMRPMSRGIPWGGADLRSVALPGV